MSAKAVGKVKFIDPVGRLLTWEGFIIGLAADDPAFIESLILESIAEKIHCKTSQITICPGTLIYSTLGKP